MARLSDSSTSITNHAPLFIFDVGGVLIGLDRPAREALIGAPNDLAPDRVRRLAEANRAFRLGLIEEDDYIALVADLHAVDVDTLYAAEDAFLIGGDPAMAELLRRLRARHRVVAFSNTHAIHWRRVSSQLLGEDAFHACYLSHELGLEKPERESYEAVASREGVHPDNIVFIDDTLANVEAAKAAGWVNAIHHRSARETIAAIDALLAPGILNLSSKTE
ncbi:MAG TPA: hypothetical protein DDW73_21920 [Rhizobium sp.]|jgi:glucose-1-phosphatase|nr:hypothetical protein [Rhizobium sp.]